MPANPVMRETLAERRLSAVEARRLAILGTGLTGDRPRTPLAAAERLGKIQVDPTSIVERAERLTIWSRTGAFDLDELRRELEEPPPRLFEYVAFLIPVQDLPLHLPAMRRFPRPEYARGRYVAQWLSDNAAFRAYVLGEIAARGPLRSRELDDRAQVPWQTGGWNDGKNVGRMLELLWRAGEIAIARREGAQRVWDLFERVLPAVGEPPPDEIVAIELMERRLRAAGLVQSGWGTALDYRLPAREVGEESLRSDGIAVPVSVEGLPGEWLAHRELLDELDRGAWGPRTILLGPFDPLIADRERTAALFGFSYRFELYIPAARREFGPYTLVLLDGEALIGRVVAEVDRRGGELHLHGIHLLPGASSAVQRRAERAVGELAEWLGVRPIGLR